MNNRHISIILAYAIFVLTVILGTTTVQASSSYIIQDDATGGDATLIGTWDATTKTCTLTQDVYGTIEINNPYITLDGAGHSIIGTGTGNGIYLSRDPEIAYNTIIEDVTVRNFNIGLNIGECQNSVIRNCNILNNNKGICFEGGFDSADIIGNIIKSNTVGIYMWHGGSNSRIEDNIISDNGDGIQFRSSLCRNALISGNTINSNNGRGIYLDSFYQGTISDNTLSNNGEGMYMWDGSGTTINKNTVTECGRGMLFSWSSGNTINNNTVTKCGGGIIFSDECSRNIVFDNLIQENQLGIQFSHRSDKNDIYNNCLSKNVENAKSNGNNFYSNYYSDYTGQDANSDGIGDIPYNIQGDDYPWGEFGSIDNSPMIKHTYLEHPINQDPVDVPEFPSVILPIATILGLVAVFGHKRE